MRRTASPELSSQGPSIYRRSYFERHYMTRDWRAYTSILSLAVSRSEPGPMLDLGAGVGYLVEAASQWGLFCIGLEGSPDAIRLGKLRDPDLNLVEYRIGQPFPFLDGSFQTIFMNQVIEHLGERIARDCLRECFRVLRSRGMLFVASPSRFNKIEAKADPTHVRMYSPRELEALVSSCGFTNVLGMNSVRPLLGTGRIGRYFMETAFRLLKWDFLSSSADCIAYRPTV
jgi:SAM-dependent methyltransferase